MYSIYSITSLLAALASNITYGHLH